MRPTSSYYQSRRGRLLRAFARSCKNFDRVMTEAYGKEFSVAVIRQSRQEYDNLIPQIPYVGGARNHMTSDLVESAEVLAVLRALKARGKPAVESCELIFRAMEIRLSRYPRFLLKLIGRLRFSGLFIRKLQRQALQSQKREYPGDFVFTVVAGDGREFDWGLDFTECGMLKFYRAQYALEFMPYICLIDYALSEAFGYGLARTKTLAEGAHVCNPRMKWNRATVRRFPAGFIVPEHDE